MNQALSIFWPFQLKNRRHQRKPKGDLFKTNFGKPGMWMVWLQGVVKLRFCMGSWEAGWVEHNLLLKSSWMHRSHSGLEGLGATAVPGTSSVALGSPVSVLPSSHFLWDPAGERILSSTEGLYRPSELSPVAFHSYLLSSDSRLWWKTMTLQNF